MELCIGIGFIILCVAILVFIAGFVDYTIRMSSKELDVRPAKDDTPSSDRQGNWA